MVSYTKSCLEYFPAMAKEQGWGKLSTVVLRDAIIACQKCKELWCESNHWDGIKDEKIDVDFCGNCSRKLNLFEKEFKLREKQYNNIQSFRQSKSPNTKRKKKSKNKNTPKRGLVKIPNS